MHNSFVSIVIINYNTKHLLDGCIKSLHDQTYKNLEIICIDNLSPDGSCEHVKKHHPNVIAVCNDVNIGYAPAGNQGIGMAKGEYVMLLNPDILFEKDYIEKCVAKMEEDHKIAGIIGKLYKYDFQNHKKTNLIDTAGLFCYKNRRIIDNGQGLEDEGRSQSDCLPGHPPQRVGQFDVSKQVFGISGACPMYRKKALEDVKIDGEFLDNDFFMYKEDCDISWRFLLFGWKSWYLPSAVANHGRGTGVIPRFTLGQVFKNRKKLNKFQRYYSYKNQRLMQLKNELWGNFFLNFPSIIGREILMFFNILVFEQFLIKSWFVMLTQIPKILKKRSFIMKKKRVGWREMSKWLNGKQSDIPKRR